MKIKKILKVATYVFAVNVAIYALAGNGFTAFADDAQLADSMGTWAAILQKALWPILMIIGGLMDNSLLFGQGMEEMLLSIWVPIRNMVNILIVVVLVGIALYNVLGIGGDEGSYTIKTMLPKIIIGIIAINFSFIGIKVFLDAINVLTTAVFALPAETGTDNVENAMKPFGEDVCKHLSGLSGAEMQNVNNDSVKIFEISMAKKKALSFAGYYEKNCNVEPYPNTYDPDKKTGISNCAQKATEGASAIDNCLNTAILNSPPDCFDKQTAQANFEEEKKGWLCGENGDFSAMGDSFFSQFGSHNAAIVLSVNIGKITQLPDLSTTSNDLKNLAINTVFSVVMYIVYVLTFLALAIVLAGRIAVLWVSLALAPVILMVMFVPAIKEKAGGIGKIADMFVKNAIAPLIIAIPMSIGFIMIQAIEGALVGSGGKMNEILGTTAYTGIPVAGLDTFSSLIAMTGTLAVIWMGVFGAAEGTIAEGVTGAIKGFGQKIGGYILQKPLEHFPIAPVKGLEATKVTLRDVFSAAKHMQIPGMGVATPVATTLLNRMGMGVSTGSNDISTLSATADVSQALGTLHHAGHIGGGTSEQLEATRNQLRTMQSNPQRYNALAQKIAEGTPNLKMNEVKTKLDSFVKNGTADTQLSNWITAAYNKQTNPQGTGSNAPAATSTPATPQQVTAAQTSFRSQIDTNGSLTSDSNWSQTLGDSRITRNSSGATISATDKTTILAEAGGAKKAQWEAITRNIMGTMPANIDKKQLISIVGQDVYDIMEVAMGGESQLMALLSTT